VNKSLVDLIENNKPKLIGSHSFDSFKKKIKSLFRGYRVDVSVFHIKGIGNYPITLGAEYDEETDIINLHFFVLSSNDLIELDLYNWDNFSFRLYQIMEHEILHRRQALIREYMCESRKYKVQPDESGEREYLSDSDEIDAYSHDIALEIIKYYNGDRGVFSNISKKRNLFSFIIYKKAFCNTDWNFIYKKLMKKTYKWVNHYGF